MYKVKNIPIQNDDIVNKEYLDSKVSSFWKGTLAEFNTAKANGKIVPGMVVYITNDTTVFDSQDIYDTAFEVETNKCFMGKTVYRKVFKITAMSTSSSKNYYIASLERLVSVTGTFRKGIYDYPIPYMSYNSSNDNISTYCSIVSGGGYVYIRTGSSTSLDEGYLVVEYTKL